MRQCLILASFWVLIRSGPAAGNEPSPPAPVTDSTGEIHPAATRAYVVSGRSEVLAVLGRFIESMDERVPVEVVGGRARRAVEWAASMRPNLGIVVVRELADGADCGIEVRSVGLGFRVAASDGCALTAPIVPLRLDSAAPCVVEDGGQMPLEVAVIGRRDVRSALEAVAQDSEPPVLLAPADERARVVSQWVGLYRPSLVTEARAVLRPPCCSIELRGTGGATLLRDRYVLAVAQECAFRPQNWHFDRAAAGPQADGLAQHQAVVIRRSRVAAAIIGTGVALAAGTTVAVVESLSRLSYF